jgi:hypothetical protein
MGTAKRHLWQTTGPELSDDPEFARRVARLMVDSAVALAYLVYLWSRTLNTSPVIGVGLVGGWILMPALLAWSLHRPAVRIGLFLPSMLVGVALLAICLTALPDDVLPRLGWILTTVGIWLGGTLGLWFWFRWLPVPTKLDAPFSPGRWALIGVHVALVVTGFALISTAL